MRGVPELGKTFKWAGIVLSAILALVFIVLVTFNWNWAKPYVSSWVSQHAGRPFTIGGNLHVSLGLNPQVRADAVRLGNATWAGNQPMFQAKSVVLRFSLYQLFRGHADFPYMSVSGATLRLEKNAQGQTNWHSLIGPIGLPGFEPTVTENRAKFPRFRRIDLENSRIYYQAPDTRMSIGVESLTGRAAGGDKGIQLSGRVRLQSGSPVSVKVRAGSLRQLVVPGQLFPIALDAYAAKSRLHASGNVQDPLNATGLDVDFQVNGADMADLSRVLPMKIPSTPVYRFSGHLWRRGPLWQVRQFVGAIGESDLEGHLTLDLSDRKTRLSGLLNSHQVLKRDVAGLLSLIPPIQSTHGERIAPTRPLNLKLFRAADVRLAYHSDRISGFSLPVEDLSVQMQLITGQLITRITTARMAGGTITGDIRLNGIRKPPSAGLDLTLRHVAVQKLIPHLMLFRAGKGYVSGQIRLDGHGNSLSRLLRSSTGSIRLVMTGGVLRKGFIQAFGTNTAKLLLIIDEKGSPSHINCAAGIVHVDEGIARPSPLVIDTRNGIIDVSGAINLGTEQIDLTAIVHPKDPSLITLIAPVRVRGDLLSPHIYEEQGPLAERAIGAIALGLLVQPLAALLPLIQPGISGEEVQCHALLNRARGGK